MTIKHPFILIFFASLAVTLSSCSSKSDPVPTSHVPPTAGKIIAEPAPIPIAAQNRQVLSRTRQVIVNHTLQNLGQPYRWGGNTPATGFDCSGLIAYTHKKAGIKTPRTSRALYQSGKPVSRRNLNPADLVFFRIPERNKALHVGIYVGDGLFVHAPGKNKEVTYARMDNPYFQENYLGSRSFL